MTNSKRNESLDEVLARYAHASPEFDAKVLQTFVEQFPEYAQELRRYAYIQLTCKPATMEEIASEPLSADELLSQQSRLLKRMQEQRKTLPSSSASSTTSRLASISGERAMQGAAIAVFGACKHGEDLLLISVIESTSEIRGVPSWIYESLGTHVDEPPAALIADMAMRRQHQTTGLQRFSAKDKPVEPPSITWEQLVDDCITDDAVKREILERSRLS